MKTGIFGGTFNPVHNGHTDLARYCMESAGLDRVIFIPTATPPHKSDEALVSGEHRLNMCRLACEGWADFYVSDIEIKRRGKSYTCDTVLQLKSIFPNDELHLIMGADMFLTLDKWRSPTVIFENTRIITLPRGDDGLAELTDFYNRTLKPMGARALVLPAPVERVSSTLVRADIGNLSLVKDLIDRRVYDYIVKNNLYRK